MLISKLCDLILVIVKYFPHIDFKVCCIKSGFKTVVHICEKSGFKTDVHVTEKCDFLYNVCALNTEVKH